MESFFRNKDSADVEVAASEYSSSPSPSLPSRSCSSDLSVAEVRPPRAPARPTRPKEGPDWIGGGGERHWMAMRFESGDIAEHHLLIAVIAAAASVAFAAAND